MQRTVEHVAPHFRTGNANSCVVSQQAWGYWMLPHSRQCSCTTASTSAKSTTSSSIISPWHLGHCIQPPFAVPPASSRQREPRDSDGVRAVLPGRMALSGAGSPRVYFGRTNLEMLDAGIAYMIAVSLILFVVGKYYLV